MYFFFRRFREWGSFRVPPCDVMIPPSPASLPTQWNPVWHDTGIGAKSTLIRSQDQETWSSSSSSQMEKEKRQVKLDQDHLNPNFNKWNLLYKIIKICIVSAKYPNRKPKSKCKFLRGALKKLNWRIEGMEMDGWWIEIKGNHQLRLYALSLIPDRWWMGVGAIRRAHQRHSLVPPC